MHLERMQDASGMCTNVTWELSCTVLARTAWQEHVLQIQLVLPSVLTKGDYQHVTVTMTIAMDTTWADGRDHDPRFGISDGEKFIAFIIDYKNSFHNSHLIPHCT